MGYDMALFNTFFFNIFNILNAKIFLGPQDSPETSQIVFGSRKSDLLEAGDGNDLIFGFGGHDTLIDGAGNDLVFGGRGRDLFEAGAGDDFYHGGRGRDTVSFSSTEGGVEVDLSANTASTLGGIKSLLSIENVIGSDGDDIIIGDNCSNVLNGGGGSDVLTGGGGRDAFAFSGDPFDGADVSADGRQIVGNEDFITDFEFGRDRYELNAEDFGIEDTLVFASVDGNAEGAAKALEGANVIVLQNSDNDGDLDTPFLAGTAANQIAELVDEDGAGFFVYYNSNLELNRLVYSENLNDASADLKIVSRQTDLIGQDAIDALQDFSAANFSFVDELAYC